MGCGDATTGEGGGFRGDDVGDVGEFVGVGVGNVG